MFGRQKSFRIGDTVTVCGFKSWGPAHVTGKNEDGTYSVAFVEGPGHSSIKSVKVTNLFLRKHF